MKKTFMRFGALAVGALLLAGATACGGASGAEEEKANVKLPAFENPDAVLTVSGEQTGEERTISKELFGVFLEDINYASQALDDNLVMNGSFESKFKGNARYGWETGDAALTVEKNGGVLGELYKAYDGSYVNPAFARVAVERAGGGIINTGYLPVPMAVKEGVDYHFSAFVKADTDVQMTVEVRDGEKTYFSTTVPVKNRDGWVKYCRTAKASESAEKDLKLYLSFDKAVTVCLDGVSFETSESTVGIKNYLYQAVKDLAPKFVRFPGGCIIEGENYEQAYDWKNSIGALADGAEAGDDCVPAFTYSCDEDGTVKEVTTYGEAVTRKPNVNLWENNGTNYFQMDYSLGFYEYFLLCESLNATALPVVNCGFSCQGQAPVFGMGHMLQGRHGKKVEDYIQDALDLVEFARGDVNTKWGKVRADMGHAEPFDMHYIGIGNEQWNQGTSEATQYYTTYYEKFLEAFQKAKREKPTLYGDIELIVGNHQQLEHCEGYTGANATGGVAKAAADEYMQRTHNISSLGEYGIQDHHYYNSPVDFLMHTHMYDGYARAGEKRYEVFVGEYSANNTFKYMGDFSNHYAVNNWFSALSEAAMMTGFERNGDIVRLAAYAPMFANLQGGRHWPVDMMLYTNTEVVRTANWYVQALFMHNTGSKVANAELKYSDGVSATYKLSGVGSTSQMIDKLYYVASFDEEKKDLIVKVVNAYDEDVKLNIAVSGGELKGTAKITELAADEDYVCASGDEMPVVQNIGGGFTNDTIGFQAAACSVSVLRIRMK